MNRIWKLTLVIVAIVLIDQFSKLYIQSQMYVGESHSVISGFFSITYVRNPGAAFGLLAQAPDVIRKPLFLLLPLVASFWLAYLIWTSRKQYLLMSTIYSLILAGAVGNLIDRFYLGYVVDFIDFYIGTTHFPAFNVADSSITVGGILLVVDLLLQLKNPNKNASDPH
ncbi:MAG: signal peptidase II [Bacteriovoracaceae bacterium]